MSISSAILTTVGGPIVSNIEKSKEILRTGEEDSRLFEEFKNLKPRCASNREAAASALHELERIAAQLGQSVDDLLAEAHSSCELEPHHSQALTLERMIGHFRK